LGLLRRLWSNNDKGKKKKKKNFMMSSSFSQSSLSPLLCNTSREGECTKIWHIYNSCYYGITNAAIDTQRC